MNNANELFILVPNKNLYCPAITGDLTHAIKVATNSAAKERCAYTIMKQRPDGRFRIDMDPVCVVTVDGRIKNR